jgi:hypothetical protein
VQREVGLVSTLPTAPLVVRNNTAAARRSVELRQLFTFSVIQMVELRAAVVAKLQPTEGKTGLWEVRVTVKSEDDWLSAGMLPRQRGPTSHKTNISVLVATIQNIVIFKFVTARN